LQLLKSEWLDDVTVASGFETSLEIGVAKQRRRGQYRNVLGLGISRVASQPSMPGIMISMMINCGFSASALSTPSLPRRAGIGTKPISSICQVSSSRMSAWSSMIKIFFIGFYSDK
jgi:hypothetical protein